MSQQEAIHSRLDRIVQQGVLRVGSTGDYKPFSYKSADGFIGLDIELAEGWRRPWGSSWNWCRPPGRR
ncbi:hypothetical protein QNM99_19880 [Pseudomonas sp. PCH446]